MIEPYFADDHVELYHGDMREVLPALDVRADAVLTDPPYGETSLAWDRWPDGWIQALDDVTNALWCFGSMRVFTKYWSDFTDWKFAQDIVWEKQNGSGFSSDRFKRVHEHVLQFYRGPWRETHHETPRVAYNGPDVRPPGQIRVKKDGRGNHTGHVNGHVAERSNTRLVRSVLKVNNLNGRGIHPTEKPSGILDPLIRYSVPAGGLVLDPFAGSGSTLLTARSLGRRAIGIEADEKYCEAAAKRLAELDLFAMPQPADVTDFHPGTT